MRIPAKVRKALAPLLDEIAAELEDLIVRAQPNRRPVVSLEDVMSELARLARALYIARKHLASHVEAERLKVRQDGARAAEQRMARTVAKRNRRDS